MVRVEVRIAVAGVAAARTRVIVNEMADAAVVVGGEVDVDAAERVVQHDC